VPQDLADHLDNPTLGIGPEPVAPSGVSEANTEQHRLRSVVSLLKAAAEAKLLFDASGNVVFASGATKTLLGIGAEDLADKPSDALTFAAGEIAALAKNAVATSTYQPVEHLITRADGHKVLVTVRTSPMVENGTVLGVGVTVIDTAARRVVEASMLGELPAALQAASQSSVGVFFLDARGNCIATGGPYTSLSGVDQAAAAGQGWLGMVGPESLDDLRRIAVMAHRNKEGWRTQVAHASEDTTLDIATAPVVDPEDAVVGYVGFIVEAVVEVAPPKTAVELMVGVLPAAHIATPPSEPVERYRLKENEAPDSWAPPKIEEGFTDATRLTLHPPVAEEDAQPIPTEPGTDKVTGLPNKVLFAQHVQATIERIKSDALTVAISFIDLAGIRALREANGRRSANDSLFLLAKRLESTIRSIEIAGAISEDIFAVLSINWLFAEDLPIVCRRLLGRLQEPLAGRNGEFVVDMKLGMSVARGEDTVESLFSRAAETLQKAKASSTEQYIIQGL
jgi:diguanylate cyclase (GGDEF)-like protein/PAS domain S-box-containing protein